jgi:hypothetical protein
MARALAWLLTCDAGAVLSSSPARGEPEDTAGASTAASAATTPAAGSKVAAMSRDELQQHVQKQTLLLRKSKTRLDGEPPLPSHGFAWLRMASPSPFLLAVLLYLHVAKVTQCFAWCRGARAKHRAEGQG